MKAKFVSPGFDPAAAGPGAILLRTPEDATKILEANMLHVLNGQEKPTSFEGLANLVMMATSMITATLLQAAACAAREDDDCTPEHAAESMAHSQRLITAAGAALLSDSVENFLAARRSPEMSTN